MIDLSLPETSIRTLQQKALQALSEILSLPTIDEFGNMNREIMGPKMLAIKMILSIPLFPAGQSMVSEHTREQIQGSLADI